LRQTSPSSAAVFTRVHRPFRRLIVLPRIITTKIDAQCSEKSLRNRRLQRSPIQGCRVGACWHVCGVRGHGVFVLACRGRQRRAQQIKSRRNSMPSAAPHCV
jgi:hypothetical protein